MWDKAKEDLTRRKQIFIDEVWQIIGASSNALAANYVFEAVKTIRGYGGGVLVATQDLNDFFSLEDGKYGRGILNNCKIKIILNLEEEEAQRVQSVLKLTDAEIDNITRFERGSALIVTNSNNVTVDMRCSEEEKDLITTDRDELRRIVETQNAKSTRNGGILMKKPVITALCCLLSLGTATAAFAEEPTPTPAPELVGLPPEDTASLFYPDSISWQENGGQLLVVKQYSVPYGTTVADLTESTMQWNGVDYTLWGVTQSVEGGVTEEKEVTQDFELSVRSADAETARNDVKESVAYDDEYGFSGTLTLQDITIGETLQADSTYMATAHYAGTVTRTEAGTVHYTLLYAPISAPVVVAAAESGITLPC